MLLRDHSAFFPVRVFSSERLSLWLGFAALALVAGCSPKIGDKCTVSTDCSATGDRLCDITQPFGYCTEFNCEPDGCPDGAACINFGTTLSVGDPVSVPAACMASQGNSPYERSFCLAVCESDSDCRQEYACIQPETIGGIKSDYDSGRRGKVCAVKRNTVDPVDAGNSDQVCIGSDAGISASTGGTSAGGASGGGAGGMSSGGAAGESGAAEAGAGGASGAAEAGAGG